MVNQRTQMKGGASSGEEEYEAGTNLNEAWTRLEAGAWALEKRGQKERNGAESIKELSSRLKIKL